jgi:hypothetical protein
MQNLLRPNDFERSDADPRLISAIALGVTFFLVAVPFIVLASYPDARHVGRIPGNLAQPPEPRLQLTPKADLDRLRASEQERLTGFGWVNRDQKIARMPIERAIMLLGERGLAGWPLPEASSTNQAPH